MTLVDSDSPGQRGETAKQSFADESTTPLLYSMPVDDINIPVKTNSSNGNVETEKNIIEGNQ